MAKKTKATCSSDMVKGRGNEKCSSEISLNKISLRGYQLHDNIILSNFENITQLEVTDNNIEYLDLSTLKKLEVVQCQMNVLSELTLDGRCLRTLTASYNDLIKIDILSEPTKLNYLNICSNKLKELPQWLEKCKKLQFIFANNNLFEQLPAHLLSGDRTSLHTLQIANNKLTSLPNIPKAKLYLREICIQGNQLSKLPENLFVACRDLINLNVSYNKLESIPGPEEGSTKLERLFATKNKLNDIIFQTLLSFKRLKILHLAYNDLTFLPSNCISNWPDLEELALSGNKLTDLPECISSLQKLKVLRLHSNHLHSIPDLSNVSTLRVIDLAHNQLGKINLSKTLPKNVRFLDLSCNRQLQVDLNQLKAFQGKRPISFVDVSGKDRFCLPTSATFKIRTNSFTPWKVGFSETPGNCARLFISQLRLPDFCNTEGLFGMFDGQTRATTMNMLPKIIPSILLQQRAVKKSTLEYLKYALVSAYESLFDHSQSECAILCHITKDLKPCHGPLETIKRSRKYILRAAVLGSPIAYLIRKQGPVLLPPGSNKNQFHNYLDSSASFSEAGIFELSLGSDDEFLVIGSKSIWKTLQIETIVQEIRDEENVILAAKRIQDIAQSFGVEENISIIILKFQNVETYVDLLINELRQNVRKKNSLYNASGIYSNEGNTFGKHLSANSDRSSPVGQSDQEISELSVGLKCIKSDLHCFAESRVSSTKSFEEDSLSRGFHTVEEESDIDENASILSEEQFKCWEYMLEQNTQLLFDKELNKITNSIIKKENSASSINLNTTTNSNAFDFVNPPLKSKISSSFPQLIYKNVKEFPVFQKSSSASKNVGSTKSFQHFKTVRATRVNLSDRKGPVDGESTNLGYFGSLQNLLPHNFENEFDVTHERKMGEASSDYESRMSQYWGVHSTEL